MGGLDVGGLELAVAGLDCAVEGRDECLPWMFRRGTPLVFSAVVSSSDSVYRLLLAEDPLTEKSGPDLWGWFKGM